MVSDHMPHPLQEKDAQWRLRGQGARPIFDRGVAPAGADEEAGGARSVAPAEDGPEDSLPTEPVFQPGGPRLTPTVRMRGRHRSGHGRARLREPVNRADLTSRGLSAAELSAPPIP